MLIQFHTRSIRAGHSIAQTITVTLEPLEYNVPKSALFQYHPEQVRFHIVRLIVSRNICGNREQNKKNRTNGPISASPISYPRPHKNSPQQVRDDHGNHGTNTKGWQSNDQNKTSRHKKAKTTITQSHKEINKTDHRRSEDNRAGIQQTNPTGNRSKSARTLGRIRRRRKAQLARSRTNPHTEKVVGQASPGAPGSAVAQVCNL